MDTSALAGCWHIEADDGIAPLRGTLSLHPNAYGIYGLFQPDSGQNLMASATFTEGAWCIRLSPIIPLIDTVRIDVAGHDGTSPDSGKNLAQDLVTNRAYLFRIREFSSGPADEPYGMFWGIMLDPIYEKMIGEVRGTSTSCLGEPIPVDIGWKRPLIIPDIIQTPDTLTITLPPPSPDFSSP